MHRPLDFIGRQLLVLFVVTGKLETSIKHTIKLPNIASLMMHKVCFTAFT